jgi:hypothetical protein
MFAPLVKGTRIGAREFLRVGSYVIPVDRIQRFDFAPPDYSGCEVLLLLDDSKVTYGFSGDLARALEKFFDAPPEDRLIAAAPDMLSALRDCIDVMENDLRGLACIQPELRVARAAYAKATTGEPSS